MVVVRKSRCGASDRASPSAAPSNDAETPGGWTDFDQACLEVLGDPYQAAPVIDYYSGVALVR